MPAKQASVPKKTNPWMLHIKKVKKANPSLSYKDVLIKAGKSYVKK